MQRLDVIGPVGQPGDALQVEHNPVPVIKQPQRHGADKRIYSCRAAIGARPKPPAIVFIVLTHMCQTRRQLRAPRIVHHPVRLWAPPAGQIVSTIPHYDYNGLARVWCVFFPTMREKKAWIWWLQGNEPIHTQRTFVCSDTEPWKLSVSAGMPTIPGLHRGEILLEIFDMHN